MPLVTFMIPAMELALQSKEISMLAGVKTSGCYQEMVAGGGLGIVLA